MNYTYETIRSARKTLSLEITRDKKLIVRAPFKATDKYIADFVASKSAWIEKILSKPPQISVPAVPFTADEIRALADSALEYIPKRVAHYAKQIGVSYGKITVRNQVSRWGSCSSQGNLNFNCTLMLCPPDVIDYVVIHELCHRRHMNHSKAFWALVEKHCPEWKAKREWLKLNGQAHINRLRAGLR